MFSLLLSLLHLPLVITAQRLTLSPCTPNTACTAPRACIQSSASLPQRTPCFSLSNSSCVCLPPSFTRCTSDTACTTGEACSNALHVCVTADLAKPSIPPPALSGQFCTPQGACGTQRNCFQVGLGKDRMPKLYGNCKNSASDVHECLCFPTDGVITGCDNHKRKCPSGEKCIQASAGNAFCAKHEQTVFESFPLFESSSSTTGMNKSTGGNGTIAMNMPQRKLSTTSCVAEHHVAHLPERMLMYPRGKIWARVLCDRWGNCATDGHMVSWQGHVGMMKSYCKMQMVQCRRNVLRVNSPRLQVTGENGVLFLTLAARYASSVEEALLKVVVRVGMWKERRWLGALIV